MIQLQQVVHSLEGGEISVEAFERGMVSRGRKDHGRADGGGAQHQLGRKGETNFWITQTGELSW